MTGRGWMVVGMRAGWAGPLATQSDTLATETRVGPGTVIIPSLNIFVIICNIVSYLCILNMSHEWSICDCEEMCQCHIIDSLLWF